MRLALTEAEKGRGRTHPNPMVGAVVARGGRVISVGHHRKAGLPHAEVEALRAAGARARGADLFVTLEPCDHHGRTPPCSLAILEAGVKRVFYGTRDPNPKAKGGAKHLKRAGVEVAQLMREECDAANEQWIKFITTGMPWIVLKAAVTLDGKLATASGDSKWISSEASRKLVHRWRNQLDAVLVGSGTVRADDPRLTVRGIRGGRDPVRVVLGSARLRNGALNLQGPLRLVLRELARQGITSVLVEGGASVHGEFLKSGLWDELRLFIAPKFAGANALSWAYFTGARSMSKALQADLISMQQVDTDVLLILRPA
jgi:diaminohydroxyphosphoribosylaminopyrimidine deaminase/5-amino-6-(5-phosphoribosylamino)uracil reductase